MTLLEFIKKEIGITTGYDFFKTLKKGFRSLIIVLCTGFLYYASRNNNESVYLWALVPMAEMILNWYYHRKDSSPTLPDLTPSVLETYVPEELDQPLIVSQEAVKGG